MQILTSNIQPKYHTLKIGVECVSTTLFLAMISKGHLDGGVDVKSAI